MDDDEEMRLFFSAVNLNGGLEVELIGAFVCISMP